MSNETYESIREALPIVGKKVVEVTCSDHGEPLDCCDREAIEDFSGLGHIYLHFDDGSTATFHVIDDRLGFHYEGEEE